MRKRNVTVSAIVLLLTTSALATAQTTEQSDRVDELIRAQMRSQNIPGLAIAVMKDGRVIKAAGYGFANIRLKTPVTPETVFKIASISKQFIATGIMLLAQDGKLSVDDSVSKYLKDAPSSWRGITIRHLLTHTSGIVREAPGFDPLKPKSDAAVIRTAYPLPLRFKTGDKYEYSNVGYFVLGEIIRIASGQPWTEFLDARVFKPSGMMSTYPTNTTANIPNRSLGYSDNEKLLEAREWIALRPSGAFLSTVLDMAKWDSVLYADAILTDATRRLMWTPVTLNDGSTYPSGFGWQLGGGRRMVHHGGGGPGIRTHFTRFLDDGLSIIVLINLDDVDAQAIVDGVARVYLPTRQRAQRRKYRCPRRWRKPAMPTPRVRTAH